MLKKICLALTLSLGCAAGSLAAPATRPTASTAALPASLPTNSEAAITDAAARLILDCLTAYAQKTSDKDTQYYDKGIWVSSQQSKTWRHHLGPGGAAAALWHYRYRNSSDTVTRNQLFHWAVETFDRAIADHQRPDGSFGIPEEGPVTTFFVTDLANAYLHLREGLDAATEQRWRSAILRGIDWLVSNGNLANGDKDGWYVNGNIELIECEMLYCTWLITGESKHKDMFERQWQFTLHPPRPRWLGYGLVYTKEPTRGDGADGAAYLAESNNGGAQAGYDGNYTIVQLETACRLYLRSNCDPRFLRLPNLLINQLLPKMNKETWTLDARNGARRSHLLAFTSCAPAVLAWRGGRSDLAADLPSQFGVMAKTFLAAATENWNHPNYYAGLASNPAVILQAAATARPSH